MSLTIQAIRGVARRAAVPLACRALAMRAAYSSAAREMSMFPGAPAAYTTQMRVCPR